jgi:lipopolysaccharide transport system ATP-binding protein
MSQWIIKVENLGKRYCIRHQQERQRYVTLRDVIADRCKRLLCSPGAARPATEDFWALKDVSFEIKKGEVVGIIGRNGSGKSTLLKLLSRITDPSKGRVRLRGRVASLLEVGTGFHPELTGRENVFLNGAILGMSKAEIKRKFDEIVAFSEVEKFLDTPVKRYSSGMYVRLAFAVAAQLEPEILIVDEVLAVGDVEFQKKCLGKMHDVALGGRTVLFVSHNMQAISVLCSRALFLHGGSIAYAGDVKETIDLYLSTFANASRCDELPDRRPGSGEYRYTLAKPDREYFGGAEEKTIHFEIERRGKLVGSMYLSAYIVNSSGVMVAQCDSRLVGARFDDFERLVGKFQLSSPWLKPGSYRLDLFICAGGIVDEWEGACYFDVSPVIPYQNSVSEDGIKGGVVFGDFAWQTARPGEQPEFLPGTSAAAIMQANETCRYLNGNSNAQDRERIRINGKPTVENRGQLT